ncbi:unnamed protein product, partial [Effrenium voratum]
AKKVTLLAKAKAAYTLEASIRNPFRLFRRQVVSPLDAFRSHPQGLVDAVRKEFKETGVQGVSTKTLAPYVANATIAMAMFHTYTATRLFLHRVASEPGEWPAAVGDWPLLCEAASGLAAGIVQGTLHTPLYNVRLCRDDQIAALAAQGSQKSLGQRLRDLHGRVGLRGCFQNYPFVLAQEACSLTTFFTSYEWLKLEATMLLRRHVDASGEKDPWAWAGAACGAGFILAAVGTPFENLLAWHVARRTQNQPQGVLRHFLSSSQPKARLAILFSGMRSKLFAAPLAGMPLLAYEFMVHKGMAPQLH